MTESVSSSSDAAAQRASEQARLRKERREAKLRAGGSARLDKITGLGGRPATDFDPPPTAATTANPATAPAPAAPTAAKAAMPTADPDEVDISQHFYAPQTAPRTSSNLPPGPDPAMSDAALRQMMMGFDPSAGPGPNPNMQNPMGPGMPGEEDPIMKMMSQMMGGGGGPGGMPQFPFGGGEGGSPFAGLNGFPNLQQKPQPLDAYTALWRLLHALVALGLGLYIAVLTPFTGTKMERELAALSDEDNLQRKDFFFWLFATAEACLLTTRFFLDKGRAPPAGIVWTVVGFLPEPFKGYAQVVLRYGQIFTTVRADILACMFVLGVCSWWRAREFQ